MKNISVLIEGSGKKFKFEKPIVTYGTRIAAKEVTVFWNFKNVTSTIGNNTFVIKNNPESTEISESRESRTEVLNSHV